MVLYINRCGFVLSIYPLSNKITTNKYKTKHKNQRNFKIFLQLFKPNKNNLDPLFVRIKNSTFNKRRGKNEGFK